MAPDPNVEDSQIVPPDFEQPVYDIALPPHASQDSNAAGEPEHDSIWTHVDETQYAPIERDSLRDQTQLTQQYSLGSIIGDTQFIALNHETQPIDEAASADTLSPASKKLLQSPAPAAIPKGKLEGNSTAPSLEAAPFFSKQNYQRDSTPTSPGTFKFGQATKPKVGQFMMPAVPRAKGNASHPNSLKRLPEIRLANDTHHEHHKGHPVSLDHEGRGRIAPTHDNMKSNSEATSPASDPHCPEVTQGLIDASNTHHSNTNEPVSHAKEVQSLKKRHIQENGPPIAQAIVKIARASTPRRNRPLPSRRTPSGLRQTNKYMPPPIDVASNSGRPRANVQLDTIEGVPYNQEHAIQVPKTPDMSHRAVQQLEPQLLSDIVTQGDEIIRHSSPNHNLLQQHDFESACPRQVTPLLVSRASDKEILTSPSFPDTGPEPLVEVLPLLQSKTAKQSKPLAMPFPEAEALPQTPAPQPRPMSSELRSKNSTKPLSRPFAEEEFRLQDVSKSTARSPQNIMKVKKSKSGSNQAEIGIKYFPSADSKISSEFHRFLQFGMNFEVQLVECEKQKELVQAQQAEIENLQDAGRESELKIMILEKEKKDLAKKIGKFSTLFEKYKTHMNNVQDDHKELINHAKNIQKETRGVREELNAASKMAQQAFNTHEFRAQKIRSIVKDVKGIAVIAAAEERNLKQSVEDLTRSNQLLNTDLERRVAELARERHNAEQFQKQLAVQNSAHQELVESLKKIQPNIVDALTKDDGVLARLLSSESCTTAKVEELSTLISNLNSKEPDVPQVLTTLIEDVFTKLEKKMQVADNNDATAQESNLKLFEDLKERISKIRLGQDTHNQLNERVSELRETNAGLTANMNAKQLECEGLTNRLEELKRNLTSCRDQLAAKSDELTSVLALPKDDPLLRSKVQELEQTNTTLQSQLDSALQEAIRGKEELRLLQESSLRCQDQIRELEDNLSNAQTAIQNAEQEKDTLISTSKADIEKAKQEVAKAASASKNEVIMRHDAQVKNLEQRRSEATSQLEVAKQELQKIQNEKLGYVNQVNELQTEIGGCKEQLVQQATWIKDLELQNPSREEFNKRQESLDAAQNEISELKSNIESLESENARKLAAVAHCQQELETDRSQMIALQGEIDLLEEQHTLVNNKYEALRESTTLYLTRVGDLQQGESVDNWAATVPLNTPLEMGPPSRPLRPGSGQLTRHPSFNTPARTTVQFPTPQEALQKSLNRRHTASGFPSGREISFPQNSIPTNNMRSNLATAPHRANHTGNINPAFVLPTSESEHTPGQSPAKKLRPANRKGSNLPQPPEAQEKPTFNRAHSSEFRQSTFTTTIHTTEETTIRVKSPQAGIRPFSEFDSVESHPSSSLTDVDILKDRLDYGYNLHAGRDARVANVSRTSDGVARGRREGKTQSAKPTVEAHPEYDISDDEIEDELSGGHERQRFEPVVHKTAGETAANGGRKDPTKHLKSALKKGGRYSMPNPEEIMASTTVMSITSAASTQPLKNKPAGFGVNKTVGAEKMGSKYNRVASSQARKHPQSAITPGHSSNASIDGPGSPLYSAPKRNAQKRKASNLSLGGPSDHAKKTKLMRLSLPRAPSRTTIPDSQGSEAPMYRY